MMVPRPPAWRACYALAGAASAYAIVVCALIGHAS